MPPAGQVVSLNSKPGVGHHTPRPSSTRVARPYWPAACARIADSAARQSAIARSPQVSTGGTTTVGEEGGDAVAEDAAVGVANEGVNEEGTGVAHPVNIRQSSAAVRVFIAE
jgi:hypothetical protein